MRQRHPSLLLVLAACAAVPGRAFAWPADDLWLPLQQGGVPINDVVGDEEQGDSTVDGSVDLVGDASPDPDAAAGYWYADDEGLYFRMRVDEDPRNGSAELRSSNWAFLLDTDGGDDYEYLLGVVGLGPLSVVGIYENTTSTPGVDAQADSLDAIVTTLSSSTLRVSEADTSVNGALDYFIDVSWSREDLETFTGTDLHGTFGVVVGTSDGANADRVLNDCAGHDDSAGLGTLAECVTDVVGIDQDGDGLSDPEEAALGTDPRDADSDDDGLTDQEEADAGTNPMSWDSDGDGLSDGLELGVTEAGPDTDTSAGHYTPDEDPSTRTNPLSSDTDGGGRPDGMEDADHNGAIDDWETDPNYALDDQDTDGDGIPDILEDFCNGSGTSDDADGDGQPDTSEGLVDSDGDGLPDFCDDDDDNDGLPSSDEDSTLDTDGDGIPNDQDPDSDGDGIDDGTEGTGDLDGDGVPNNLDHDDSDGPAADPDGDGILNGDEDACGSDANSTDSDSDGIPDNEESCDDDVDCDGLPDRLDADPTDGSCDSTPIDTAEPTGCTDLDGDGVLDCGYYAGGSCSTTPGNAGVMLALAGALALTARRRPAARGRGPLLTVTLLLTAIPSAWATDKFDAQRFHPSLDSQTTLGVEDPQVTLTGFGGGVWFNYAQDPLVYRSIDGSSKDIQLVGPLFTADAQLAYTYRPFRLGIDIPVNAYGTDIGAGGAVVGDILVDGKYMVFNRVKSGYGLGVDARLSLPTGAPAAWLGDGTPTVQVTAAGAIGKKAMADANLGFRSGPTRTLSTLSWGNRMTWGLGGSLPITSALSAFTELDGEIVLVSNPDTVDAPSTRLPGEWRVGARYQILDRLQASLAGGGGYSEGIGSPSFRIIAGITSAPPSRPKAPPAAGDRDHDGIPDAVDNCPDQAEDINGKNDSDGCPDAGLTPTHFVVIDPQGRRITGATLDLVEGPENGRYTLGSGEFTRSIPPGPYRLRTEAPTFMPDMDLMDVPAADRFEKTITLKPESAMFPLTVVAKDEQGRPVQALVTVLGSGKKFQTGPDGIGEEPLRPGPAELSVWAEGFAPERVKTVVQPNARVEVTLRKSRVEVHDDQVVILDKVFFELDSAILKAESIRILDDVAATLISHPDITLLEVQGHTDDQGSDEYNIGLSQKRAEAVRDYLIAQGVERQRLVPKGYGETLPLQPGTSEEAREANRRVAFMILRGPKAK